MKKSRLECAFVAISYASAIVLVVSVAVFVAGIYG